MLDFAITPRTRGANGPLPDPLISIEASGDATLEEAMKFALSIIGTVQAYGNVRVETKP